jgi:DnaJ-class molecular chaperone
MAAETQPLVRSDDCLACRGNGQVVSSLGGEPKLVPCPWCEGSGVRLAGHDAQARWRESAAAGAGGAAGAESAA